MRLCDVAGSQRLGYQGACGASYRLASRLREASKVVSMWERGNEIKSRSGGSSMSDTLSQLNRRVQPLRARWGTIDWAWITVELEGISPQPGRFIGVALVDGQWRGDLFTGEPRSFRVESGERSVAVYLCPKRRDAVCLRNPVATLQVELRPGEQARLRFGVHREWKGLWALWRRDGWVLLAGTLLITTAGWLSFPWLREVIASVTLHLDVDEPWLSFCYFVVRSRVMTAGLAMESFLIFASVVLQVRYRRRIRVYEGQFGKPWFLTRGANTRESRCVSLSPQE